MRTAPRVAIFSVIAAGCVALLWALAHAQLADPVKLTVYTVLAILAGRMKITFLNADVALSVGFVVIYVALFDMTTAESILFAWAGVLGGRMTGTYRGTNLQLFYNCGTLSLATAFTSLTYLAILPNFGILGMPVANVVATTLFYLINTILITFAAATTTRQPILPFWKTTYAWSYPYYLAGGALAGLYTMVARGLGWQNALLLVPIGYFFYRAYLTYQGRVNDSEKHAEEIAGLHLRTIEALALAIEAKDDTTHAHLRRVQTYAVEIGRELGLVGGEIDALRAAAILHDIGKLAVPEYIICKPGKLTPDEFDKMKIHPVVGAEILEHVRFPYPVAPIVRSHHEKWNGAGYPDGLKGEEIPIGARILATVDCLDALASDRQYRKALPLAEAMAVVRSESGKSFDPRIVEILERRYPELDRLAQAACRDIVKLSTNVKVERGIAPAAGFEQTKAPGPSGPALDFLASIASARSEVQAMFELTSELGSSLSFSETLGLVDGRLKRLIPHDSIALYRLRGQKLEAEYVSGENSKLLQTLKIPLGDGLAGWVAQNQRPILNGNPAVEPGYLNDPSKYTTLRSALAVPLAGVNGFSGVLVLYSAERDAFQKDHQRVLQAIAAKLAVSIENALRYQLVESNSTVDALTGLPNFRTLLDRFDIELSRCKRSCSPLTLAVIALADWKLVSDRYGNLTASRLFQATSSHLKTLFRDYDLISPMGSDEFVLLMPDATSEAFTQKLPQIREFTAQMSRQLCEEDLGSLVAGWATTPADGETIENLLNEADRRRYQGRAIPRRAAEPAVAPAVAGVESVPTATLT